MNFILGYFFQFAVKFQPKKLSLDISVPAATAKNCRNMTMISHLPVYQVITTRVHSTREGTVFTGVFLFMSVGGGGTPIRLNGGYPISCLDGGTPFPGPGGRYLSQVWMWVTPHQWDGVPPSKNGWGTFPAPSSMGSMPLAFTQEDFLVNFDLIVSCITAAAT